MVLRNISMNTYYNLQVAQALQIRSNVPVILSLIVSQPPPPDWNSSDRCQHRPAHFPTSHYIEIFSQAIILWLRFFFDGIKKIFHFLNTPFICALFFINLINCLWKYEMQFYLIQINLKESFLGSLDIKPLNSFHICYSPEEISLSCGQKKTLVY